MLHRPVVAPTILASVFVVGVAMSLGLETNEPGSLRPSGKATPSEARQPAVAKDNSDDFWFKKGSEPSSESVYGTKRSRFSALLVPKNQIRGPSTESIAPKLEDRSTLEKAVFPKGQNIDFDSSKPIERMRAAAQQTNRVLLSQLDVILLAHDAKGQPQTEEPSKNVVKGTLTVPKLSAPAAKTVKVQVQSELNQPVVPSIEISQDAPNETNAVHDKADYSASLRSQQQVTLAGSEPETQDVAARNAPDRPELQSRTDPETATAKIEPFSTRHFRKLLTHAHATRPATTACVAELQLIAARTQIYFDTGSSSLDARGVSAARLIAAKVQSCPQAQISILGFTDPSGSKDVNLKISWKRANSVFRLIRDAGFSMSNIEVSSHMEDHPDECLHYEGVDRRVIFSVRENLKET